MCAASSLIFTRIGMSNLSKYKVTAVIVNYNKEPYISQCIESVINQSLQPIEIIIVDDGSTDKSGIISSRYAAAHPHVRYLTQENKGVSSARNKGLSYAQGEYVTFLDADDYVPADAYDRLYKAAVKSDADTAVGNFECFNEYRTWHLAYMKKVFAKGLPAIRHISTHKELHLTPSASNKLFKKDLLMQHNISFDEDLHVGEDLLFTQKSLYCSRKTVVENSDVLYYRVNDNEMTLSKNSTLSFFKQLVMVQQKLKNLYDNLNEPSLLYEIEKRQAEFFFNSLFTKGPKLPNDQLNELLDTSSSFLDTLVHREVTFSLDSKSQLLTQMIVQRDYEEFMNLMFSFCKDEFINEIFWEEGLFYSSLAKTFPRYKQYLEVKHVEVEQRIELIELKDGQLTLGGYAFIKGLSAKGMQKDLVFKRGGKEKAVPLQQDLRTDVSYLFSHNQIDYQDAGFKTISLDVLDFLEQGEWQVYIRLTVNDVTVEEPIKVMLAQLRNRTKTHVVNNIQIKTAFNTRSQMKISLKKVNILEKLKSFAVQVKRDIRYDASFLKAKDYHTFLAILLYRMFRLFYVKKQIWLIGERKDTAQDNSYHLYQYIRKHHPNVNIYYVIDKKSPDYQFIKHLGNIIHFNSLKHTFYLLISHKTINSYVETSNMHTESYKKIMKYYPEWQQNEKIFIQHGVIGVSRVNHVLHKNRMNYSQFVVSSPFEKKHVMKEFGYSENEVIETGLARWDALEDTSTGKEILIMPTWRSWIKTEQQLFTSDYWRRYLSLLENEEFHRFLEQKDLTVTFFPHYQMQKLIGKFPAFHPRITVVKQGEETVQNLLRSHSMLLTDYSTVSFDFAYMNKPVLFYQFDYDDFYSKHYNEGPINHKKDLFGERVETEKEVIQLLKQFPHFSIHKANKIQNYVVKEHSHSNLLFKQLSGGNYE